MNKQQRFEISNINKMIDRIDQIKQLYAELSEETKEKLEKEEIMKKDTIAIWCGYAGLGAEIKDIEYSIDDRLLLILTCGEEETAHKVKINYSGRVHVKVGRLRINLDECVVKM